MPAKASKNEKAIDEEAPANEPGEDILSQMAALETQMEELRSKAHTAAKVALKQARDIVKKTGLTSLDPEGRHYLNEIINATGVSATNGSTSSGTRRPTVKAAKKKEVLDGFVAVTKPTEEWKASRLKNYAKESHGVEFDGSVDQFFNLKDHDSFAKTGNKADDGVSVLWKVKK